jgi:hypothetical protein
MSTKAQKGRNRKVSYDVVVAFATANPSFRQAEIATHFGLSQCRVSRILTNSGIRSGFKAGSSPKPKRGQSELAYEWEQRLHKEGLGMDRGLTVKGKPLLYGYDHRMESRAENGAAKRMYNAYAESAIAQWDLSVNLHPA